MTHKHLTIIALFLFFGKNASAQTALNRLEKVAEGLYFMYYDSSKSKSTVLEMSDGLALIEVPIRDEGGGATHLKDHSAGAEKALRTLRKHFPKKPLRYLLHSHWHPHSMSSMNPFLRENVQIFSTQTNFDIVRPFVDSTLLARKTGLVTMVTTDTLRIGDVTNPIVIHRFLQKDFTSTPTEEYLYFYLPRYNYLHCGCMFFKWEGELYKGREIRTGRVENLYKLLKDRGISPTHLIRLVEKNGLLPFQNLENIVQNGISSGEIYKPYLEMPDSVLLQKLDDVAANAIRDGVPPRVFNTLAYQFSAKKQPQRALAFAKLQTLLDPSDPNAWDSLGEMYWFAGEQVLARHYGKQARKIDPAFVEGGEEAWQKNWEEAQKKG